MPHSKWLSLPFVAALGVGLLAQQPKTFKARLSPVPIDIVSVLRSVVPVSGEGWKLATRLAGSPSAVSVMAPW